MIRGLAIDPGTLKSGWVVFEAPDADPVLFPPWGIEIVEGGDSTNDALRAAIYGTAINPDVLVVETLASLFGGNGKGSHGRDQLAADRWGARFHEAFAATRPGGVFIPCASATAKAATIGKASGTDAQVRRAIIDAYGGDAAAFGVKCKPCKGRGWKGRGRAVCGDCWGSGWEKEPGALFGFPTGTHGYRALALAFAAFRPGGLFWASKGEVRS